MAAHKNVAVQTSNQAECGKIIKERGAGTSETKRAKRHVRLNKRPILSNSTYFAIGEEYHHKRTKTQASCLLETEM